MLHCTEQIIACCGISKQRLPLLSLQKSSAFCNYRVVVLRSSRCDQGQAGGHVRILRGAIHPFSFYPQDRALFRRKEWVGVTRQCEQQPGSFQGSLVRFTVGDQATQRLGSHPVSGRDVNRRYHCPILEHVCQRLRSQAPVFTS